jgi:hypothetical protein
MEYVRLYYNKLIGEACEFNYLRNILSPEGERDLENKIHRRNWKNIQNFLNGQVHTFGVTRLAKPIVKQESKLR